MSRLIDLDTIEFLKVDGNKEFNHGVDCCINTLLKAQPVKAIPLDKVEQIRAEVKQLPNANPSYWCTCDVVEREDVLELIDEAIKEQTE